MPAGSITVVHKARQIPSGYERFNIDRGTPLGNPFVMIRGTFMGEQLDAEERESG